MGGADINIQNYLINHIAYPTNQDIYDWFTYGDNAEELVEDNALITTFRNAMIDFN